MYLIKKIWFTGTESVVSSDPLYKNGIFRFTSVPLNPKSDQNLPNLNKNRTIHFRRETANENEQFKETKTLNSNLNLIRQSFLRYRCKSGIALKLRYHLTVPINWEHFTKTSYY